MRERKVQKCPICGTKLVKKEEKNIQITSKVTGGSISAYEGSIDVIPLDQKNIKEYWVCPNSECPYLKEVN